MKELLTDPEFGHWPIVSIASLALRDESLVASLCTWYKYARYWNIDKKLVAKIQKHKGLISDFPNQYLHVDTTHYWVMEGQKIYISFVIDNYSRKVLGYHVFHKLLFLEGPKQALKKAMNVIENHPDRTGHSFLVTDGGGEYNNKKMDEFITNLTGHKLTQLRALKDIIFSNSPVEAIHRTMKGRYLCNRTFDSVEKLVQFLEWAVDDYNNKRPHYRFRPYTPAEVYYKKGLNFDIRERMNKAMKKRIKTNQCSSCTSCKRKNCVKNTEKPNSQVSYA